MSLPYRTDVADGGERSKGRGSSSSGSESSSTEEEERLRRLFQACDRDGDGYIDSHDVLHMCQLLNMEDAVEEIMQQLGVDAHGRISFNEFVRCRMQLLTEIEQERLREQRLGLSADRLAQLEQEEGEEGQICTQQHRVPLARLRESHLAHGESDNSLGLPPSSQDYDSGARDLSPEPPSLYKLLETHEPAVYQQWAESPSAEVVNFLHVANSLHLAALTSLKGEIIELNTRLQHVLAEKDLLEKQVGKHQTDKLRLQREAEDRLEQQTIRYEDRVTELHSVIAELRKKIDRTQINVIREEDEFLYEESDGVQSNKSIEDGSVNENNANESQSASVAEIGNEINAELSRVVSELESAINETRRQSEDLTEDVLVDRLTQDNCDTEEKSVQVGSDIDYSPSETLHDKMADTHMRARLLEEEISRLQSENRCLHEQVGRQETELNKLKAHGGGVREERDRLKRKVRELQTRVQSLEAVSPRRSPMSTPTKHASSSNQPHFERSGSNHSLLEQQTPPVSKLAELKKLKTWSVSDRPVFGSDIADVGLPNSKVAEHLVQSLQEGSDIQEIAQSANRQGSDVSDHKVQEFEIEVERLQSKIDHLKSQNDLTLLSLDESKAHCDRLTVLMGKYESNNTAMQLALNYCDQALEAYQVLVSLLDSEIAMLLANCKASGLGTYGFQESQSQEEIVNFIQKTQHSRRLAENLAKQLMQRMERPGQCQAPGSSPNPWEELSSNSRNTSTTSSTASSTDAEWSKSDEKKLRDVIQQLQTGRTSVRMTVMELESIHIDPLVQDSHGPSPETQRLDLENAVLIQELMAIKEEKAELKAHNYMLEKEKTSLELEVNSYHYKEQAYQVHIKNLKTDLVDNQQAMDLQQKCSPRLSVENIKAMDLPQDLEEALKREQKLKARVQELVHTLEILSRNSEYRHQQSATFVHDLKQANSALIAAFEKAKKKYQAKLKKQEGQIQTLKSRYDSQVGSLIHTIAQLKADSSQRPASETSL